MDNVPTPDNPKMMDLVLAEFQAKLKNGLDWLDYACGRVTEHNEEGRVEPKVYIGGGDYAKVMPDDRLGNYCFFDIAPEYKFAEWHKNSGALITVEFGLVFWFDLKTIYTSSQARELETLKNEIFDFLTNELTLKTASYWLTGITDDARGVFTKFARQDFEEKYLLHPYGGLRFNGKMSFRETR